jgi:hypothetical protein
MRKFALILASIWALWWFYFGLVSGAEEGIIDNALNAIPGLIFVISVIIAWRWQKPGGIVLLVEGIILLFGYPRLAYGRTTWGVIGVVVLMLALPALLSGFLLLTQKKKDDIKKEISEVKEEPPTENK